MDKDQSYQGVKDPVIRRMLERFKLSADSESDNRKRGLHALKFSSGGKEQWDSRIYQLWSDNNTPTESYNQIPQFVHQITNDQRMNMPQTRFIAGTDGDEEVAEVYEDLSRAIQASSEGEVAYDAAVDNQVRIGWGYWRYITDYENENTFDQVIKIRWVPNPFTIYDDPHANLQDRSDRRYLIEVSDLLREAFNAEYKSNKRDETYSDLDMSSIGDTAPDWCSNADDTVRIAEYWEIEDDSVTVYRGKDGQVTETKPDGEVAPEDQRTITRSKVMWRKCTALEVLEEREWIGSAIPYVFVAGEQLNIDGKWRLSGVVESMMPAQRQYNYAVNSTLKVVALAPNSPFIADPKAIEGYEKYWDTANIKDYAYLPYRSRSDDDGQMQYNAPQRLENSADIGSLVAMQNQAQQLFYNTSGIYPASLGQASNEKSGKAILARQREGDTSTFHYGDNLARGQRAGGRILLDLIPKVYDSSREINLLREDGTTRRLKINQQFKDEKTGKSKKIDLTVGTYSVMVTTGPSFTTRRQEASEAMITLAQSTDLMQIAPDKFYRAMDWPGASDIADRYEATPVVQQLIQAEDKLNGEEGQGIPPQVQQQMQQMQQQLQMLAQQLEQAQAELQNKQGDLQVKMADQQNKQAELQLKAQQMQLSAGDSQRQAELDMAQKQLDAQKLQLDQQKLAIEGEKLQIQRLELQLQAMNPQTTKEQPDIDLSSPEMVQGHLNLLMSQKAERQMQLEQAESQREQDAIIAAHQADAAAIQAEQEHQRQLQQQMQMTNIQNSIDKLSATIAAPKQVVRDANGMVAGVVTANGA